MLPDTTTNSSDRIKTSLYLPRFLAELGRKNVCYLL